MMRIWPPEEGGVVDDQTLERLYGYPADRPRWMAVNFVSSADGAAEVAGRSRGLTNPVDQQVYRLGSDLADVILVGARTATIEEFRGPLTGEETAERRERHGLAEVPPIAVVTSGESLPPDAPVLTDVRTPSVVITCAAAPPHKRASWAATGAKVLIAGTHTVDLKVAVDLLAAEGMRRIHCDGGPHLFGSALAAGVVDELRLSVSPLLIAGAAGRIAAGAGIGVTPLTLASVLAEGDTLMVRYLVRDEFRRHTP